LVNGAPEPVRHTVDLEYDLVRVPLVTGSRQPAADLIGESLAELAATLSQRLVANHVPRKASISSTIRKLSGKRK
jgi:hypothetical protein